MPHIRYLSALVASGLLAIVVGISGCAPPAPNPAAAPPRAPLARVAAQTVRRGDVEQTLSYSGAMRAREQISVVPKVSGRIERIAVDVGSRVNAGDVLVVLDQDTAQNNVLQARAQLAGAEARLATLQIGPRAEDVTAAQAAVAQQESRLRNMRNGGHAQDIRAAEDGVDAAQARQSALWKGADSGIRQAQQSAVDSDGAAVASAEAAFAALGGQNAANLEAAQAQVDSLTAQAASVQALIASADAALQSLTGSSAADVQAAESGYEQAQAQLQVAQAALKQNYSPPQAAIAQAQAAVEAARNERAQAEALQTALEQNAYGTACSNAPVARNSTACGDAKAAADAAVTAANAGVEAAQGQLDLLKRGGSTAQQAQVQAAVDQAQAQVATARARLDALQNGGVAAARAQADAQKQQAQAQLVQTQQNLKVATANLAAARNGSLDAQVKNAQAQLTAARERLKADQARLDVTLTGPTDEELQQAAAAVDQAQAQLAKARQPYTAEDLDQQEQAVVQARAMLQKASNPYTEQDMSAAQAAVDQVGAQLALAELNLRETTVTAPVDGIVSARAVAPGALVSPQTPMLTLVPPALELVVNVQESQIGQIGGGQSVELQVAAFPAKTFSGVVKSIAPTVDDNTRTTEVRIAPDDADSQLRAGMFAQLNIVVAASRNTLVVPREAVVSGTAGSSPVVVTIDDSGKSHRQPVTLGLRGERQIEILSGVEYGQLVATSGVNDLKEGDLVAPQVQQLTARAQ